MSALLLAPRSKKKKKRHDPSAKKRSGVSIDEQAVSMWEGLWEDESERSAAKELGLTGPDKQEKKKTKKLA